VNRIICLKIWLNAWLNACLTVAVVIAGTAQLAGCTGSSNSSFNDLLGSVPTATPEPIVETADLSLLVHSEVTVSSSACSSGGTVTVNVQLKRDTGASIVAYDLPGKVISFFLSGGTSRGTFGTVTDAGGGRYTAVFTGSTVGSGTSINAVVEGFGVLNDTASLQVIPGALSLAQTAVTVVPPSVFEGANALVTLTAKDVGGNLMGAYGTGKSVLFSLSTGAGMASGTFSPATDNGDGTYSSYFTGSLAGTAATVAATVNGSTVTSVRPTIQVVPAPGPSDLSILQLSTIAVSSPTVASGTGVTVTLSARITDGMGGSTPLTTGGLNVVFFNTAGTSTGTIGSTTDNANGTYTATFTGEISGTATTIRAIVGGYGLVTNTSAVTVTPGSLSLSRSVVSVSPVTIYTGSTSTVTLTTKDNFGNSMGASGSGRTVAFSLQAAVGLSQGTISASTDIGDGTYTATFTGTLPGAAAGITGFVNAAQVTSAAPSILVIASPAPVLNSVSDRTFSSGSPLVAGATLSIDFFNTSTNDDSGMVYTCFFDKTFDASYGQPCSALPGTSASFDTSTGVLNWVTSATATWGAYAFRVQGTKSSLVDTKYFIVNVRQPYDLTDILADLDPNFAQTRSRPPSNTSPIVTTWTNLVGASGSSYDGLFCGVSCLVPSWLMSSSSGWNGIGTSSSPYRLAFNGTNGVLDLGSNLQDSNYVISLWARFGSISSTQNGSVILTNSATFGNGITLKQSAVQTGRVVLLTGGEEEYSPMVLQNVGNGLRGYWRMQDNSPTNPLYDSCTSCNKTLSVTATNRIGYRSGGGAISEPSDPSHLINNGGTTYVSADMGTEIATSSYTVDGWLYATGWGSGGVIWNTGNSPNGESSNCSRMLWATSSGSIIYQVFPDVDLVGDIRSQAIRISSSSLTLNVWNHIAVTHVVSADPLLRSVKLYVNGVNVASSTAVSGLYNQGSGNRYFKLGNENTDSNPAGYNSNRTCDTLPMNNQALTAYFDEFAVYSRVLSTDEIRARYRSGSKGVCRVGPLVDNTWYHLGLAFSGGKSQINIARPGVDANNLTADCTIDAGTAMVGSPAGNGNTYVGATLSGTNRWSGAIGDLKFFTSDIVDANSRVDSVYQSTKPRFP
jgi:hypothetical protein